MDRIGAVTGAIQTTGGRIRTERTTPSGQVPDRQAGINVACDALAELFEPERDTLRLPPERLAVLFLGLLFTSSHHDSPQDTTEIVEVYLHAR
jgi:hypothetical protein